MRTLVFDFGGVLFRWHPPTLLQRVLPQLAHDEASAAHWTREIFHSEAGDWQHFDRGLLDAAQVVRSIAQRTGLAEDDVQRVLDGVPDELQPIADSVALLARLRAAGHRLAYLSNMPAPYAERLEREHDFVGWFADGVFSSRVHEIKPDAAVFRLAAEQFGRAPAELVFLDDHLPNVAAARALGWNALHYAHAAQAESELRAAGWI